uniref:HDC14594 n=1 Tax=Drosophila melanogaster TaxID=7227 RepID=Q6IJM9_DROME|nr:TPA_inf: HDC14594 [Drosophila melanogaster]
MADSVWQGNFRPNPRSGDPSNSSLNCAEHLLVVVTLSMKSLLHDAILVAFGLDKKIKERMQFE